MRGLPLVAASRGHSSSRCAGLSLSWPLLLRSTGSRCAGSVVVAHGPSCSAACGIFPDQGSNPCPLQRQADSQPLRHRGSPKFYYRVTTWFEGTQAVQSYVNIGWISIVVRLPVAGRSSFGACLSVTVAGLLESLGSLGRMKPGASRGGCPSRAHPRPRGSGPWLRGAHPKFSRLLWGGRPGPGEWDPTNHDQKGSVLLVPKCHILYHFPLTCGQSFLKS